MGKTHNDEEYEKGVREGKAGDFIEDVFHSIPPNDSPRDKGYQFGKEHRNEGGGGGGGGENNSTEDEDEDDEEEDEEEARRTRQKPLPSRLEIVVNDEPADTFHDQIKRQVESEVGIRGPLLVDKHNRERYLEIIRKGELWRYSKIVFVPDKFEAIYKCDLCSHQWYEIAYEPVEETIACRNGCTAGSDSYGKLAWAYKVIKSIITGKPLFGYGRLVQKKEI